MTRDPSAPARLRAVARKLQDRRIANRDGVAWSCSHRARNLRMPDASRLLDRAHSDAINTRRLRLLRRFRSVAGPALLPTLLNPVLSGSHRCQQSSALPRGHTAEPLPAYGSTAYARGWITSPASGPCFRRPMKVKGLGKRFRGSYRSGGRSRWAEIASCELGSARRGRSRPGFCPNLRRS